MNNLSGNTPNTNPVSGPTKPKERIDSLDVLRGVAILGILVMNIQSFSMIAAAYFNPSIFGDLNGLNYGTWRLSHVLMDMKFMTIFSMLFGAGIVLMTTRWRASGKPTLGLHYRRMLILLLIGLVHAYGLWYGDILFAYAMCGFAIYWFRNWSPVWQVVLGLLAVCVGSGMFLLAGLSLPYWPAETMEEFLTKWKPQPEAIARELEAYRGGWLDQMRYRAPASLEFQTFGFLVFMSWRYGGAMLIGMALFKWGVFGAGRSRRFYWGLIVAAVIIGVPLVEHGVRLNFEADWDVTYTFFIGSQYNYWGSLVVALGWISAVMLVCHNRNTYGWTRPLAAVGRMALTNYLLQTLVCTTLFYGHGFAFFGKVERIGQVAIVFAVWIVQLILSSLWLTRFRFGPVEWVWRYLTYMKRP